MTLLRTLLAAVAVSLYFAVQSTYAVDSGVESHTAQQAGDGPVRAQLQAKNEVMLSSGIAAKIQRLPFRESQTFKKGDLLIQFDCSIEKAEHQFAKAALSKADTTVQVNERLNSLQSISTLELKTSQSDQQMAASKVALISAKLKACREFAPFDGRIAELEVHPLQRVKPGDPLMLIYDPSILEVELRVPSSWLKWIKPGQIFKLHIEETNTSYDARVKSIGAFVDPISQTVKIIGELDTHGQNVLPGMSGNATFTTQGLPDG